jgi:hypothetical protein
MKLYAGGRKEDRKCVLQATVWSIHYFENRSFQICVVHSPLCPLLIQKYYCRNVRYR